MHRSKAKHSYVAKLLSAIVSSVVALATGQYCTAQPPAKNSSFIYEALQECKFIASKKQRPQKVGDKWALVVGISEFKDPVLNTYHPAKDAQAVRNSLIRNYGFAPDHIAILTNHSASSAAILRCLGNGFLSRVCRTDDIVLIYMSSHGATVGQQGYLAASDTDSLGGSSKNAVAFAQIKSRVQVLAAKRKVVILECCNSAAIIPAWKRKLLKAGLTIEDEQAHDNTVYICSSWRDQLSWSSSFTSYFLQLCQVRGVSLLNLYTQACADVEVESLSPASGEARQSPTLTNPGLAATLALEGPVSAARLVPVIRIDGSWINRSDQRSKMLVQYCRLVEEARHKAQNMRFTETLGLLQQSEVISRGCDVDTQIDALETLTEVSQAMRLYELSDHYSEFVIKLCDTNHRDDDPALVRAHEWLAESLATKDKFEEAKRHLDTAFAIRQASGTLDQAEAFPAALTLAQVYLALEMPKQAYSAAVHASTIARNKIFDLHPEKFLRAETEKANALCDLGKFTEAQKCLQPALDRFEPMTSRETLESGRSHYVLATIEHIRALNPNCVDSADLRTRALENYIKAAAVYERDLESGFTVGRGPNSILLGVADALFDLGQTKPAIEAYSCVLGCAGGTSLIDQHTEALIGLIQVAKETGDAIKLQKCLQGLKAVEFNKLSTELRNKVSAVIKANKSDDANLDADRVPN